MRSGTTARVFVLFNGCAALLGLINIFMTTNPGLAAWAMQEYRLCRAHPRFHDQSITLFFDEFALG